MKIIDKKQIMFWMNERRIQNPHEFIKGKTEKISFCIPNDSGKKNPISKEIVSKTKGSNEILLWIDEFGIWPNCEDRNLFDRFRKSLNEEAHLFDRQGHVIESTDYENFNSLLLMVLYFYWGCWIIPESKDIIVRVDHHGIMSFFSNSKEIISDIKKTFEFYECKQV